MDGICTAMRRRHLDNLGEENKSLRVSGFNSREPGLMQMPDFVTVTPRLLLPDCLIQQLLRANINFIAQFSCRVGN